MEHTPEPVRVRRTVEKSVNGAASGRPTARIIGRSSLYSVLLVVAFILVSSQYLGVAWRRYADSAAKEAILLAQSLESVMDPEHIASLAAHPGEITLAEYTHYKQSLMKLVSDTSPIRFTYLMGLRHGQVTILLDSEPPDSPDYAPPGLVSAEADSVLMTPFRDGSTILTKPVTDRRGTWISALVPVKDPVSNRTLAVFGIDYSAYEWNFRLWRQMIPDVVVIVCLFCLLLALLISLHQKAALKSLSRKLAYDEALYHNIFTQAPIGIALVQGKNFVLESEFGHASINPMFERILGRKCTDLASTSWTEITHPEDLQANLALFNGFAAGRLDGYTMEKRYIRPDGSPVWTNMHISRLNGIPESSSLHLCLLEEITDRKKAEGQLRHSNEHDPWTGLYNRRYLERILHRDADLPASEKRALISINLNTMYLLSLMHGFNYSQTVLLSVADALKGFCSENRLLFSSYEYRLVFYVKAYADSAELMAFCAMIAGRIAAILLAERITGAMGVLEIDAGSGCTVDLLLKNLLRTSEDAIKSDGSGIGISCFDAQMAARFEREDIIRQELAEIARGQDTDRLVLQYQPILDIRSGRICGFEALARLNSDRFGRVAPNEFVPLIEKSRLIVPLGNIIINKSLQFLKTLEASGHGDVSVSINVTAVQIMGEGFAASIISLVRQLQVNPALVGLELTESVFASNYDHINKVISELKAIGMTISIDDFGTGYSSLAREREINASCLKIDKFFIDKLMTLKPGETITSDIISMGHKLGHVVVAEGVEHDAQLRYLREHGCDMIQGYLISRPLDEGPAIEFLKSSAQSRVTAHIHT